MNDGFSDPMYCICTILGPSFKFYWTNRLNLQPAMNVQLKQSLLQLPLDECQSNSSHSLNSVQHAMSYLASTSIMNSSTTQSIENSVVEKLRLSHCDDQSIGALNSVAELVDEINTFIRLESAKSQICYSNFTCTT